MKMKTMMYCAALGVISTMAIGRASAQASDADKKFLAMAAQSDQNEIALSKLAEEKATNPDVKNFAETMVKQHTELTDSMKPFAEQWGLTPPTGPDEEHQKEIDKLNTLSGSAFDKEYMDDMMTDHTKAYAAFSKEVKDTKDAQFKAAVIKGKAVVAAHKNMAYSLKKKLS